MKQQSEHHQPQQFWARVVMQKWLNTGNKESNYSANPDTRDSDGDNLPRLRRQKSSTFRSQYINKKELRVCVGTWNVEGILPPDDLDIDEWLDINSPADIYVLGFQEIVPFSAGNISGAEDTRPIQKWENIVLETLNRVRPASLKMKSLTSPPSPSKFKLSDDVLNIEGIPLEIALHAETDLEALMKQKRSPYVRIISKQMVGTFITIWVRRDLRKHIQNLEVSTVGLEVKGYKDKKGSISVSMSIYQTLFCFICVHLKAGETEADGIKRNAAVNEIHRRTRFHSLTDIGLPRSILDHERIIWFGDLNYRINLSYDETINLISKKEWAKLIEKDQLVQELRKGAFCGWSEGTLNFPPTYKYELNSDKYSGEDSKVGRRIPAWCDRILTYGKGLRLMSYRRSELKISDHRPVTATYMAEVEEFSPRKLQRALTFTDAEIKNHDVVT